MKLDADICYRALTDKDLRFDGKFFVGVKSTHIYCRPICPARTPRRDRCEFFTTAQSAANAGFRACLRCRPELAPGSASVDAVAVLAAKASAVLDKNSSLTVEALARILGVTSRHLRRALHDELGLTPTQLRQQRRIENAKRMLTQTDQPLTRIAFASGFASLRRFNAVFREVEGCPPSALRKEAS